MPMLADKPWVRRTASAMLLASLAMPAAACTVEATSLSFGSINPLAAGNADSTSTVTVTCPATTAYTIALSAGSGTYADRQMASGANTLSYQLYTDASRATVWGDGTGSTATVDGSADGTGTPHTVYGRVPPQSTAVPGAYADTVTVTVSF
jgi:spore coat protein U-like protein